MTYPATTAKADNPAFDVSANQWNAVANAINALLHVSIFDVVIDMNTDHTTLHHALGTLPMAIVCAPVDDVGRCWYDMNTINDSDVDIYVANPPMDGGYLIRVILYY
jgi:hypothetical protein